MRAGASLAVAVLAGVWLTLNAQSLSPDRVQPRTVFAVGDIMHCSAPLGAELTGRLMQRLLDETPNSIGITLGDNSNDDGSEASYDCFDRSTWGRLMPRLHPVPGNHDYDADPELPFYYRYFVNAGAARLGYRAYDFGTWRLYALNTELASPELRQAQLDWLDRDLRGHYNGRCTLAYFHRPPFSSGNFASPRAHPLFRVLYKYGVDLVVTGHEHFFATLPPLTPEGAVNPGYGVPVLIAGTGGAVLFNRPAALRYRADGERLVARQLGVLQITLQTTAYNWTFIPVDPAVPRALGGGACHDNPPGYRG